MNQLQLLILLLLVDTYIPDDVQGFIQGQDFAMFSFDFIPSTKIPYIKIPTDWMEFEQSNEVLKDLGVASRSTFNNSFSLILVIIGIIALHVFIKILPKYKGSEEGKRGKCGRLWNLLKFKLLGILLYGMYLRLFLEANQTLLFSSISEIQEFDVSGAASIVSLVIAFVTLIL